MKRLHDVFMYQLIASAGIVSVNQFRRVFLVLAAAAGFFQGLSWVLFLMVHDEKFFYNRSNTTSSQEGNEKTEVGGVCARLPSLTVPTPHTPSLTHRALSSSGAVPARFVGGRILRYSAHRLFLCKVDAARVARVCSRSTALAASAGCCFFRTSLALRSGSVAVPCSNHSAATHAPAAAAPSNHVLRGCWRDIPLPRRRHRRRRRHGVDCLRLLQRRLLRVSDRSAPQPANRRVTSRGRCCWLLSFALSQRARILMSLASCRAGAVDGGGCSALAADDERQLQWLLTLLGARPAMIEAAASVTAAIRKLNVLQAPCSGQIPRRRLPPASLTSSLCPCSSSQRLRCVWQSPPRCARPRQATGSRLAVNLSFNHRQRSSPPPRCSWRGCRCR